MDGDGGLRIWALLALLPLASVAAVGLARGIALARRGVWVLPIDRERRPREALGDLAFALGLAAWAYEAVATVLAPGARLAPASIRDVGIPWPALRAAGLALATIGAALYVRALQDFGGSWRFTIDRAQPGELVTRGVFGRSRNPVYLALSLLGLGTSLALGSAGLTALAGLAPLYFRWLIGREERFLRAHYGEPYLHYCERVGRWWTGPGQARPPKS